MVQSELLDQVNDVGNPFQFCGIRSIITFINIYKIEESTEVKSSESNFSSVIVIKQQ